MYFTADDFKQIEEHFHNRTVKDTQFPEADPLKGNESIPIIQDNKNKILGLEDFIRQVSELELPDFYNISNAFNRMNISLEEAISLVPNDVRKLGLTVTFLNGKGNWVIYQFKGKSLNQWNSADNWVNIVEESLEELMYFPDEEDITQVRIKNISYLKFKDKEYAPNEFSGLGRVYLRKNLMVPEEHYYEDDEDHFDNILTEDMLSDNNVIYIVQYDYNLEGKTIDIPENCILWFHGGSFNNGTINLSDTPLIGISKLSDIGTVKVEGTFNKGQILTFVDNKRQILKWWNGTEWLLLLDITDYNAIIGIIDNLIAKHNKDIADCYKFFNDRCDTLQTNIDTEKNERIAADNALGARIDSEASARATADSQLNAKITQEQSDRIAADNTLQSNITKEANDRAAADTALTNSLNTEIQERKDADITLTNSINTLKSSITSDYATKKEVDDRIKGVIGTAPEALDTLGEIADALKGDDDAIKAINDVLEGKANADNVYTKTEVDNIISSVNNSIVTVNTKAENNKSDINTLKSKVSGLESSVTTINTNVENLSNTVTNINNKIDNIENNEVITNINADISGLKSDINTLKTDVNTNKSSISSINGSISSLDNRVTELENKPDGGSCDCDLTEITDRLDSLEDKVEGIGSGGTGSGNIDLSGLVKAIVINDEEYLPNENGRVIIPLAEILENLGTTIKPDNPDNPDNPDPSDEIELTPDNSTRVTLNTAAALIISKEYRFEPNIYFIVDSNRTNLFTAGTGNTAPARYVHGPDGTLFNLENTYFSGDFNFGSWGIIVSRDQEFLKSFTYDNFVNDTDKYINIPFYSETSINTALSNQVYIPGINNEEEILYVLDKDIDKVLNRKLYYYKGYVQNKSVTSALKFFTSTEIGSFSGSRILNNMSNSNAIVEWGIGSTQEDKPKYVDFFIEKDSVNGYEDDGTKIVVTDKLVLSFIIDIYGLHILSNSKAGIYMNNTSHKLLKGLWTDNAGLTASDYGIGKGLVKFNTLPGEDDVPIAFNAISPILSQNYEFVKINDNKYRCDITLNMSSLDSNTVATNFFLPGVILSTDTEGESSFGMLGNKVYYMTMSRESGTDPYTEESITYWKADIVEANNSNSNYGSIDITLPPSLPITPTNEN